VQDQVEGEPAPSEAAPGADSVPDLRAKLAKIKRQALAFKAKLADAAAARDAALEQLAALKVLRPARIALLPTIFHIHHANTYLFV
jgi:hypothetical protein